MSANLPPTREELLAIYRAGPDAMVALVEVLLARISALEPLEEIVAILTTRGQPRRWLWSP